MLPPLRSKAIKRGLKIQYVGKLVSPVSSLPSCRESQHVRELPIDNSGKPRSYWEVVIGKYSCLPAT